MGVVYLAALIFGLGSVLVQLLMGGEGDADTDASAEVDHADLDHGDLDGADLDQGDVDVEAEGDAGHHADGGLLPIFLSLRFWVFGSLTFGLVGSLLHFLEFTFEPVTVVLSGVLGVSMGAFASWVFKRLSRDEVSSSATLTDPVGHVGKVLIPIAPSGRGKIRIQIKGQTLDVLARTDEAALEEGELVLVEEMKDGEAQVSRAPADFLTHR